MRLLKILCTTLCLLNLSACSSVSLQQRNQQLVWQDQLFSDEAHIRVLSKQEVFELSPALRAQLEKPKYNNYQIIRVPNIF